MTLTTIENENLRILAEALEKAGLEYVHIPSDYGQEGGEIELENCSIYWADDRNDAEGDNKTFENCYVLYVPYTDESPQYAQTVYEVIGLYLANNNYCEVF